MGIIEWLNSPEGEAWSRKRHSGKDHGGNPARHSHGLFAALKDDHECHGKCGPYDRYMWLDKQIRTEIRKYGMNALPDREAA